MAGQGRAAARRADETAILGRGPRARPARPPVQRRAAHAAASKPAVMPPPCAASHSTIGRLITEAWASASALALAASLTAAIVARATHRQVVPSRLMTV